MVNNSIRKAIIIGGGIAGPAAALFLKKIGVASEVYEAGANPAKISGGLLIAANGMNVLAELSLSEKVIAAGSISKKGFMKNSKGKFLAKFRYTNVEKYNNPCVNVKRTTFTQLLTNELELQSIAMYYNKLVTNIFQNADGVEAHFNDGSIAKGDILIGADGVRSTVRNFVLANPLQPSFTGVVGCGGFTLKSKIPDITEQDLDNLYFVYGIEGFFGYGSTSNDEIMWWTNIKTDKPLTKENLRDFDKEYERQTLLKQYGKFSYPVPELIAHSTSFLKVNVFDVQSLPNWSKNRVILIGDSAHAVSPNAGQGVSIALEDAMLLARLIRDENSFDEAFNKFETERKPRVEKIVQEGRKRGIDKTIVSPFQQWVRELMIKIFVNLFGEKGNDWLLNYKIKWDK